MSEPAEEPKPRPKGWHFAVLKELWDQKHHELNAAVRVRADARMMAPGAAGREDAIQFHEARVVRLEEQVDALAWALDRLKWETK